jgi:hypothetical protein
MNYTLKMFQHILSYIANAAAFNTWVFLYNVIIGVSKLDFKIVIYINVCTQNVEKESP